MHTNAPSNQRLPLVQQVTHLSNSQGEEHGQAVAGWRLNSLRTEVVQRCMEDLQSLETAAGTRQRLLHRVHLRLLPFERAAAAPMR
eukprot:SAG11_NODE_2159_length_3730_cov_1.805288_1_plen_86_part_00